jgi:hypothetical protein
MSTVHLHKLLVAQPLKKTAIESGLNLAPEEANPHDRIPYYA